MVHSHKAFGIYADAGASLPCVKALRRSLQRLWPHRRIILLYRRDLLRPAVYEQLQWICMPGGRDLPYLRLLQGPVIERIRTFIQRGGAYLGSCAGAYFAASKICFAPRTELAVVGRRPLRLWRGLARGPVGRGTFCYQSERGADAVALRWYPQGFATSCDPAEVKSCFVYTNGGCAFVPEQNAQAHRVWASYADGSRAAVGFTFGRGRVLLWGVHPEFEPHDLICFGTDKNVCDDVLKTSLTRRSMWHESLRWLE